VNALLYHLQERKIQVLVSGEAVFAGEVRNVERVPESEIGKRIDLIICDIEMPRLRGPTLIRQLKDRGVKCPVLFISGELSPDS